MGRIPHITYRGSEKNVGKNKKKQVVIDGLTFAEWFKAAGLCSMCNKGWKGHWPAIVIGTWFARCKETR